MVVGGVAARGVAAQAATRRAPTREPGKEKTAAPKGVAVWVAVGREMAAEAAALIIRMILHVLVNCEINDSVSLHAALIAKTFKHFKHISIYLGGDSLLCYLFHILNILVMIIPIITSIRYMIKSCTPGPLKLYMIISMYYYSSYLCGNNLCAIIIRFNPNGDFSFVPIIEIIEAAIIIDIIYYICDWVTIYHVFIFSLLLSIWYCVILRFFRHAILLIC